MNPPLLRPLRVRSSSSLAKNARSARVIAKIVSAPSCAWRITTPPLGRPLFSGRLQRPFHPPLRGGGPPTIGDVLAPLEEGFNQFALATLRRKRQPLVRLFLRLRPRTANWIQGTGRTGHSEGRLRHRRFKLI